MISSLLISCGGGQSVKVDIKSIKDSIEQVIADSIAFADSIAKIESMAKADSIARVDSIALDNTIIKFITDMYNKTKFVDDTFLESHCSSKMLSILRDEYDLDCEEGNCYGVWLFRSGAQDGPNDRTEIISVKPLGNHWYRYDFYDMGNRANNTIKVIEKNGKIIIDDIKL